MRLVEYRPLVRAVRDRGVFCIVQPRVVRFGEWYLKAGEIRRVPLTLALPRRLSWSSHGRVDAVIVN
jgi:hypothetical protein